MSERGERERERRSEGVFERETEESEGRRQRKLNEVCVRWAALSLEMSWYFLPLLED